MARKAQMRSEWLVASSPEFAPPEARISPDLQDRLGLQLRAMYDQMRSEPMPERILDLLTRLDPIEPKPPH
jgi:hypothetical protein